MLKLCRFPGIKIQNNLYYKIVGPFVSCVLAVALSHWAFSARSGCLGAVSWGEKQVSGGSEAWHSTVCRSWAIRSISNWGWTPSSDFSAFCLSKLQFLRSFSCSCWYSKSVLSEGIDCIWWSRMKCMGIKCIALCMHSMWVSIWDCVCWYVSLVIKQLKKKKGSAHRQFWHSSPGKWQLAREYWGRAKTIWRIPNAEVGCSSFLALVLLFTLWARSWPALYQVDADNRTRQNWR